MMRKIISIRPFIGAKDFQISRRFYRELGFEETELSPQMSVFKRNELAFYLQNAFVQNWINNTMIFLEVEDLDEYYRYLVSLDLSSRFEGVRLKPIRNDSWGRECFLHDPSGVLWHVGEFYK